MKKSLKPHRLDNLFVHGKRLCIIGLQGSGKTELAKYFVRRYSKVFIVDPMNEYGLVDCFTHKHRIVARDNTELTNVIVNRIEDFDVALMVVDEISRFCPSRKTGNLALRNYADVCRHSLTTFLAVARRPGQVQTDFTELAHYLMIFRMRGKNDSIWLANQAADLVQAIHLLDDFHFVLLHPDRSFEVCEPVDISEKG